MPEMPAQPVAVVDEHDPLPERRGLERREAARRPTADDDDVGVEVALPGVELRARPDVHPTQACRVSEHPLVQRPEARGRMNVL